MIRLNDTEYLTHYGVLGMKWGIHRKRKPLGIETLSKSRTANLESWGKDANHNILYVTGYSGSGKSTLARNIADDKTNVIHLDPFFEKMDKNVASKIQDKEFKVYLDRNFPSYKEIANPPKGQRHSKEWWNKVDSLMGHTEKFASEQFSKKKKVIVEGVQLSDETTYPDKNFFKDKPLVIAGTGPVTSFFRASKRDEKIPFTSLKSTKEYIQWYSNMFKSLDKLADTSNAKVGSEYVKSFMDLYGDDPIRK